MTWDKSNQGRNEPAFLNEDGLEPARGIVLAIIWVLLPGPKTASTPRDFK